MKITDYIAQYLHAQGVEVVFDVVGGMITHLLDSIYLQGNIRIIDTHHEQAASFAADAVGRMTGIPGIAMATSGPGATNLLTGIGSCYFDSSPAIFITGQVNRNEQKGTLPIRQLGFQETDIVSMVGPITKAAWRVETPEQLPGLLAQAFEVATSGRPGPVLLDIPMDVQRADIPLDKPQKLNLHLDNSIDRAAVRDLLEAVKKAKRPLILAGGGIRSAHAEQFLREFVRLVKVPVVNSLMAVDALPYDDPFRLGLIGSYGNRWANHAIAESDLLIVLGSRLDIRQTGAQTEAFKGTRTIYHVDCDMGEINNRIRGCLPIVVQLRTFFEEVFQQASQAHFPDHPEWLRQISDLREQWPDTAELKDVNGINPNVFMHQVSRASKAASTYIVDVGQHQMWAAQSLELTATQRFITSGGMGAMGFALPAAIGTGVLNPSEPVIMIAGDGSFQLNIQELQTVVRNKLPLKMIILNNNCHGMVRQFQQSYFEERYTSTYWGYSAPDFAQVALAYDIDACTVAESEGIPDALRQLWQDPQKPFLLQVIIDTFANAYPKLAFGHPITEMEPLAKPMGMEGT